MPGATDSPARTTAAPPLPLPLLTFRLRRRAYALPLSAIVGVADVGRVRHLSGAPRGVLGLADWHGDLVAVLDAARLLGDVAQGALPTLVRLAAPHAGQALYLAASLSLASGAAAPLWPDDPGEALATIEHGDERIHVIDPARLLARTGELAVR